MQTYATTSSLFNVLPDEIVSMPPQKRVKVDRERLQTIASYVATVVRELVQKREEEEEDTKKEEEEEETIIQEEEEEEEEIPVHEDEGEEMVSVPADTADRVSVAVPWSKGKPITEPVKIQRSDMFTVSNDDCTVCAVCAAPIPNGTRAIRGCASDHHTHLACGALVAHHMPNLRCRGAMFSACAEQRTVPVSLTETDRARITELAVKKLNKALNPTGEIKILEEEQGEVVRKASKQRTERNRARYADLIEVMQDPTWTVTDRLFYPRCREVMKDKGRKSVCTVCYEPVGPEDSLATCKRHKAHKKCYAYFRCIREQRGWKQASECPGHYFSYPDCSGAFHVLS